MSAGAPGVGYDVDSAQTGASLAMAVMAEPAVEPTAIEPTAVEPTAVEPTVVEPTAAGHIEIAWVKAVEERELWEGDILDVEVSGEQVLLVSFAGQAPVAYQGVCPHQEVLLGDGSWDEERGILVCAGHAWEFDLRRGQGINPAGCMLFEYPVRVVDGVIEIGVPQDGQRHYRRCPGS